MKTHYIHFCQQYTDPVWGAQPLPWMKSPLVRVTRNRLRKAHFEWVGNPGHAFNLEEVRSQYPLAMPNAKLSGPNGPQEKKR